MFYHRFSFLFSLFQRDEKNSRKNSKSERGRRILFRQSGKGVLKLCCRNKHKRI